MGFGSFLDVDEGLINEVGSGCRIGATSLGTSAASVLRGWLLRAGVLIGCCVLGAGDLFSLSLGGFFFLLNSFFKPFIAVRLWFPPWGWVAPVRVLEPYGFYERASQKLHARRISVGM